MEGTVCDCFDGYQGAACEQRVCPSGPAWADIPTDTDTAHGQALCSNKGYCDYTTGTCTCLPGFEGKACERMSCSNNCNVRIFELDFTLTSLQYIRKSYITYMYPVSLVAHSLVQKLILKE